MAGRPPIGKKPMTVAERVRRHRARLAEQHVTKSDKPVTKSAPFVRVPPAPRDDAEIAALKARIATLEAENARLKAKPSAPSRNAEPHVTRDDLSMTAAQKLDAALRREKDRLEIENIQFRKQVRADIRTEMMGWLQTELDTYNKNATHYEIVLKRRQGGFMTRAEYRSVLSCLHPDRIQDDSLKRRYEHAFNLFTRFEKLAMNESESPTKPSDLPQTVDELLKRRADIVAKRAADRAARKAQAVQRR